MISGVANVWTNFSYFSHLDTPNGWLLNPESSLIIFFEKINNLENKKVEFYTHLFYATESGEPGKLKNTRAHSSFCAIETWNELITSGWTVVTHKFQ